MENENRNDVTVPESAQEALSQREEALKQKELRLMAGEELLKRDLSREIAQLLDYSDREKCLQSLDTVQRLISVEAARLVDKRLGSRALPGGGASMDPDALSDREYYALTLHKTRT